ncbi:unnamed protein product [Blepharisma stoltei]|uniref:t-SNARE coiled-coil homology domain-containing protein n=1 Tax=Blepharisma stoltei TaxID=1481888 RepID=A0AAU9JQ51_9CILI|nr:unnamed protein product [Blepharisma stoltei]
MSTYNNSNSVFQEHAALVKEFQQHIKKLKDLTGQLGTAKDNQKLHASITQEREFSIKLCKQIIQSFKEKQPSRAEKIQHDNLTKQFEALSKQFQSLCQMSLEKQKTYVEDEKMTQAGNEPEELEESFKSVGGLDEALLKDRFEEVQQLEKDMITVNAMFKDVSNMVVEQGGMLDSAENNVEVAVKETGRAVVELNKAEVYQKKSKGKLFCILGIVIVVVLVLVAAVVIPVVMT